VSALGGDITRVAYGACKAAINALTIYTATQYGRQGIRCNAVCPGFTLSASAKGGITDNALEILGRHTLTPYLGTPEHLAEVVTFLASPAAAYITGQIISVDGGLLSHHPQTHDQLVAAGA
jgi:NAD(P)-dependent dehydrogenase (short-subunit alcohol dehydrogenase family)